MVIVFSLIFLKLSCLAVLS